MTFSETIKSLRIEEGLTQKALAQKLNIGQSTIVGYEKGEREPVPKSLISYSKFFNVSVDYLLGLEDDLGIKKYSSEHNRAALSEDESELLKNFRKLGPFARESIIIQVNALAEKNEDRQKTF